MYKIKSIKGQEFKIINKETKEILTFTSTSQIFDFVKENVEDIDASVLLNILEQVTDMKARKDIFNVCADVLCYHFANKSDSDTYNFIIRNADLFNIASFRAFVYNLDEKFQGKLCENINVLPSKYQIELLNFTENHELMLQYWEENKTILDTDLKVELLCGIGDENLLKEFYEENKDSLSLSLQLKAMRNISDAPTQIEFYESHKDELDTYSKCSLVEKISDDNFKLKFLSENATKVDEDYQSLILSYVKDVRGKINFLKDHLYLMDPPSKQFLNTLSFEELRYLYFDNELRVGNWVSISSMFRRTSNMQEKLLFIKDNLNKFSGSMFVDLLEPEQLVDKGEILQLLLDNENSLTSEQLLFLVLNSPIEHQSEYFDKFQDRIEDVHKYMLTSSLTSKSLDKLKIDEKGTIPDLPQDVRDVVDKILKNFGLSKALTQEGVQLLSPQCVTLLGEENVYQLFKYCVMTDTMPDVSKALENPSLFEQYQEFRKQNFSQNTFDFKNIQNALIEFNQYYDLIAECLTTDLTDQEKDILIGVLNDKNVKLSSKDDLLTYPEKRSEYIDELMGSDIKDAIAYVLTGKSWNELYKLSKLFFNESSLGNTLNDFGEELHDEIVMIMAMKEIVELINNESEEVQKTILQNLKSNLEQEFSQGSLIAEMRNIFPEFESELRSLYGNDLRESLVGSQMPPAKKVGGVDVIRLNGQDFKLLVHGLNACGAGADQYEHRDVGSAYICTSLISESCIQRAHAGIYYGFQNISSKSLALEGSGDIGSYAGDNSLDVRGHQVEFARTDKILQKTTENERYNEIVLFRDQIDEHGHIKPITPDYIVAFGKISRQDRAEAKRLKIPIVVINEFVYGLKIQGQKLLQKKKDTKAEVEPKENQEDLAEVSVLREKMMTIIKEAKNNCTARQQEAITAEMTKQFKLMQEQEAEKQEVNNV